MMKLVGLNYTRTLIIARTTEEDVGWIEEQLGFEPLLKTAVYTVDVLMSPYIVLQNKGHKVMPYLTYIIMYYYNLSDVTLFIHAHAVAWHNNDLLDSLAG